MSDLVNVYGSAVRSKRSRPEPNTITEEKVRSVLKGIDELLDIKWIEKAVFNPKYSDIEGRYALVCRWPSGDKRWELVYKQEVAMPYDMIGWFCEDIQNPDSVPVAPDSVENKVLELLYQCDGTRFPHLQRMAQITEKNKNVHKNIQEDILNEVSEIAKDLHFIIGHREDASIERIKREIIAEGVKRHG